MLVGASPVQLTPLGKLISKHSKAPPSGGFLLLGQSSIVLEIFWCKSLAAVAQNLRAAHHAPQRVVACSNASDDHANLIRSRSDDSNESPILHLLRWPHAIRSSLAHGLPDTPILLYGPRLADDLKRKREQAEFEHLFGLAALSSIGVPQVVESICVEQHIGTEVRRADRGIVSEQFFGAIAQAAVILSIHKVARL